VDKMSCGEGERWGGGLPECAFSGVPVFHLRNGRIMSHHSGFFL